MNILDIARCGIKTTEFLQDSFLYKYILLPLPTLHDSMDGTGKHYAKWNKSGGEREYMISCISGT